MARLTKKQEAWEKTKLKEWTEKVKEVFPQHQVRATGSIKYRTAYFDIEGHSGVNLTFQSLCDISELLGTKMINVGDHSYESGCETCDWGAVYSCTISCSEVSYGEPQ